MSVKTPINSAIHVIFCTAIALLLAFIIRESAMDYDADIQVLAQKTAQNGQLVIAASNKELCQELIKIAQVYPSVYFEKYVKFAQVVNEKSDSIRYLVDSLGKNKDITRLSILQGVLNQQRSLIIEMADFDKSIEAALPTFLPSDWLYQSWKNDTKEQYKTVLEQAKTNSLLMEKVALFYVATKVIFDGSFDKFQPVLNWKSISPTIGDTMYAAIYPSGFTEDDDRNKFTLNGIPLADQKFRQRFNKAGTYPLHIKVEREDWAHDTVLVAEKTYYVTVRKQGTCQ
jgi:hypothetical protein